MMEVEAVKELFPADTVRRAKEYLDAIGSTGAYTESQGAAIFRQQIALVRICRQSAAPAHIQEGRT